MLESLLQPEGQHLLENAGWWLSCCQLMIWFCLYVFDIHRIIHKYFITTLILSHPSCLQMTLSSETPFLSMLWKSDLLILELAQHLNKMTLFATVQMCNCDHCIRASACWTRICWTRTIGIQCYTLACRLCNLSLNSSTGYSFVEVDVDVDCVKLWSFESLQSVVTCLSSSTVQLSA